MARRRRDRRRALIASSAAVVGVVVIVSAVGLAGDGGRRPGRADAPGAAAGTPRCEATSAAAVAGSPVVPDHAVAARLCGVALDLDPGAAVWPDDVIDGPAVAELVDEINALSPYEDPDVCTQPLVPSFDLVLAYADGSQVRMHGDRSGSCANLAVHGGGQWARPDDVLQRALALVREERASHPLADPVSPGCPDSPADATTTLEAAPVAATSDVAISLCRYRASGQLQTSTVVRSPALLTRLLVKGSTSKPCDVAPDDAERRRELIVLQDVHGDRQTATTQRCRPNAVTGAYRYPVDAFVAEVVQLLDDAER
jgi:hypothetical protein